MFEGVEGGIGIGGIGSDWIGCLGCEIGVLLQACTIIVFYDSDRGEVVYEVNSGLCNGCMLWVLVPVYILVLYDFQECGFEMGSWFMNILFLS